MQRCIGRLAIGAFCVVVLAACHKDMWDQPRFTAHQKNPFFPNNAAARTAVPGTVSYAGHRRDWTDDVFVELTGAEQVPPATDDYFWTGKQNGQYAPDNYFDVNLALLKRGQERFGIYCTPCHGQVGDGQGVVKQRGFPQPANYHIDRLRAVEDGYVFDVITNGFGRMYSYAARVSPEDRWAITAYIRALQYSQYADLASLPPEDREAVTNPPVPAQDTAGEHGASHENTNAANTEHPVAQ